MRTVWHSINLFFNVKENKYVIETAQKNAVMRSGTRAESVRCSIASHDSFPDGVIGVMGLFKVLNQF